MIHRPRLRGYQATPEGILMPERGGNVCSLGMGHGHGHGLSKPSGAGGFALPLYSVTTTSAATVFPYNVWTNAITNVLNGVSGAAPVLVTMQGTYLGNYIGEYRLQRNGTEIVRERLKGAWAGNDARSPINLCWIDTPGAGDHTYTVDVLNQYNSGTHSLTYSTQLSCIELSIGGSVLPNASDSLSWTDAATTLTGADITVCTVVLNTTGGDVLLAIGGDIYRTASNVSNIYIRRNGVDVFTSYVNAPSTPSNMDLSTTFLDTGVPAGPNTYTFVLSGGGGQADYSRYLTAVELKAGSVALPTEQVTIANGTGETSAGTVNTITLPDAGGCSLIGSCCRMRATAYSSGRTWLDVGEGAVRPQQAAYRWATSAGNIWELEPMNWLSETAGDRSVTWTLDGNGFLEGTRQLYGIDWKA